MVRNPSVLLHTSPIAKKAAAFGQSSLPDYDRQYQAKMTKYPVFFTLPARADEAGDWVLAGRRNFRIIAP